jgi:dTDP-N-acetylfucosamine:lipid II N-acetylfucosaminyltransferase
VAKKRILHIAPNEKFIPAFMNILEDADISGEHRFYLFTSDKTVITARRDIHCVLVRKNDNRVYLPSLLYAMYRADKIILHGLFIARIIKLLSRLPWTLRKCYWFMWGGDFYFPDIHPLQKKNLIKKMGHLVTYLDGDYRMVQENYGAQGMHHECFMYPSNLYTPVVDVPPHKGVYIQVGNSAAATNNHLQIFESLLPYKDADIRIYCPLSYGGKQYAQQVMEQGRAMFGDKFMPMCDFMPIDAYHAYLSTIDIAIFNHDRQQAMGNIITLAGMGAKLYLNKTQTPWELFNSIGVKVYDCQSISLEMPDEQVRLENSRIISGHFSKERYIEQLQRLFA